MHIQNREPDNDIFKFIFYLIVIISVIKWIFFDND
jgi:hypothetical protein